MEPVRGGQLATLSEEATAKLAAARPEEKVPAWAFRFLQAIPEVTMTLSGMSNMQQLKDNIATYEENKPLNESEMELILGVADDMIRKTNRALYRMSLLCFPLSKGTGYSILAEIIQ